MTNNNTLKYRVKQLETNYREVDKKIDKILTNDLPHIQRDISNLKTEVRIFAILNVVSIILAKLLL